MAFTKTEITSSTLLGQWPGIINSISDGVLDNAQNIVNSIGSVYSFTQKVDTDGVDPDNSESFDQALARFQATNSVEFKKNDVAVVKLVDFADESIVYEQAAYTHDGNAFVACTGAVDADKVIMRENITLAGDYTAVGNIKKPNTTGSFEAKGKSVADILVEMLSKRVQPSVKTQPSVTGFGFKSGTSTSVEAGTTFSKVELTAGTFNDGEYTYETNTGATVSKWEVKRIYKEAGNNTEKTATVHTVNGTTLAAWADESGIQIGDTAGTYGEGEAATPVLSTFKYSATATYGDGNVAKDNLGSPSDPEIKIAAGTKTQTISTGISCYRNYFYGAVTTSSAEAPIDGDFIRTLTKSGKAYAKSATCKVEAGASGAKRMIFACVATATGITSAKDTGLGAENIDNFKILKNADDTVKTIDVPGANGYEPIAYKVWVYEPAVAFDAGVGYNLVLG
jgi:hypothetical protein